MYSLSRTLVLGTTLLTSAVLVIAGVALYVLVRMNLLAEIDRSLVDRARLLASTVEIEDGRLDLELVDLDGEAFEGQDPKAYVQVWTASGKTLYKSSSLASADLARQPNAAWASGYYYSDLPSGVRGRAVCLTFTPRMEGNPSDEQDLREAQDEAPLSLAVAQSMSHIEFALARLRLLLFLVGGGSVAVATSALWYYVARSLRPLNRLAQEIGQVSEDDLATSVGQAEYPREIGPVITRLNHLLSRVNAAFQRERTMNANVAHELRTPLTGLRLKLDVAVSRSREAHEYRQTLDECRVITSQLQQLVGNLLSLARLNAGQFELYSECVEVDELIQSQWGSLSAEADRRRLEVRWCLPPKATVVSDKTLLGMAVRNLLENAVTYADEGGDVSVRVCADEDHDEISVVNSGSQLTQEEAESALIPFWQHDQSRNTTGVHCGLGLSLVQQIVAVLRGQLSVESQPGGDFQITVTLPRK